MVEYTSNLSFLIKDFIDFKRSIGFKYPNINYYLKFVDKANLNMGNYSYLTKEVVEEAIKTMTLNWKSLSKSYYSIFREFGRYLFNIDGKSYILDDRYKSERYHAQNYLFSNDEIAAFFKALGLLVEEREYTPGVLIIEAIFTFLYFCGVRCAEARLLKSEDVHLEEKYIIVRNSKNHNDRKLFITEELAQILSEYNSKMSSLIGDRVYFFSTYKEGCQSAQFISNNFKIIWTKAGLNINQTPRPRAYDFRHHFACANIMKWMDEGKDVHAMLPYLMTYMGHSDLDSTYYYIHLIPDFLPKYNELSSMSNQIIPEVEDYEI